jgi:glutamine amidotransferase
MVVILDYKAGNLTSVQRALNFLGRESVITREYEKVMKADRLIFPGVGAAGSAMSDLARLRLDLALRKSYYAGKPILGICLGTQIIMEWSEENETQCLGLIKGKVRRFHENLRGADGEILKVPHMGWNGVSLKRQHPLFDGVDPASEFYFVHSYYPVPDGEDDVLGETDYGMLFPSVLMIKNLVAVQFHLEKSGRPGLKILSNFCDWDGKNHA